MGSLAADITPLPSNDDGKGLFSQLQSRAGNNLYIALTGPIGSGVSAVAEQLGIILRHLGYKQVFHIKLSEHFDDLLKEVPDAVEIEHSSHGENFYDSYRSKQKAGNSIREHFGQPEILASVAIEEIQTKRLEFAEESFKGDGVTEVGELQRLAAQEKVAFIIDQLKRPEEVSLLRQVYKELFYLCAVVETRPNRQQNLEGAGAREKEAEKLMDIDKRETDSKWGQQVQKTVLEADYFHNNNNIEKVEIRRQLKRFVDLIHGQNGIAPTREEFGMYQAHTASLGSLCLSRQVGAAILDSDGNLLSVGRNDVPKYGGGLYENTDIQEEDNRCVHYGDRVCHNDKHKAILRDEIKGAVNDILNDDSLTDQVIKAIENSKIKNIVEYSRSIHAEMDAIISLSRKGVKLERGSTLYSTTFPCHMCARHIITSGIQKVIYIEPYEKSLAIDLHDDSISTKSDYFDSQNGRQVKVEVRSFHGTSPRKYQAFFSKTRERKHPGGKAIILSENDLTLNDFQYVVSFLELEQKAIKNLRRSDSP